MAAVAASPTPFASSYNEPARRTLSRQELYRPASRPNLRRGVPLASSVNNPPVQQPFTFSMGDSSDDEMPVPPMKFSAEVKSLLGDEASVMEGSSPSQKREEVRGILRLDRPIKRSSPLALSEKFREKTQSPASRSGSPRVVRLYGSHGSPATLGRSSSLRNETSPSSLQHRSYVTPAPRSRLGLSTSSGSQGGIESGSAPAVGSGGHSSAASHGPLEPSTNSNEQSGIEDAEAQMGNLSITRHKLDDGAPQTGQRQRRVQLTGTFLRGGKARRGMKRRQSEDEPSPDNENHTPGKEPSPLAEPQTRTTNDRQKDVSPSRDNENKNDEARHEERPAHVRFQSQASIVTGSPEQKHRDPAHQPANEALKPALKPTATPVEPVFKLPPMPPLPSRHDQENEPPPTFKRNKNSDIMLGDRHKYTVAQDDKMLAATPVSASPARQPLAARSQNTPLRPAPPPPKMSVLETATAPAGAASASHKKKRNYMFVNGKMFTRMDCIGRGGSSKVFRVMAENYKIFALKRVTLEDQDELAIRGYKGEIDLLRKLENVDRVVRLFDFEINEEKHTLSVLMEMGESDLNRVLTHRLNAEEPSFDITTARYYWKEMLECVASVHDLNIVHSDLKPANFLLLQGRLKLIDFGISNAIADNTVNVHREQHIGTPNYMSPEALIDSNAAAGLPSTEGKMMKLGKPSDVWSLGCILYQMVYGKPPFAHIANQMQRIMAIPNTRHIIDFPPTGFGGVALPAGLLRTMKRCLNRDQTQRPTVSELLGPKDEFLNPDLVVAAAAAPKMVDGQLPLSVDVLKRMQANILKHIREKGMPSQREESEWPDRFYWGIKAAIEEGRA